jgi:hypothetical protein
MVAGDRVSADPGVAVNANAENTAADAMAILPIVFITLSDKFEALVYFEMSPMVVSIGRLAIESLLRCKQSKSRQHDCLAVVLLFAFRNVVC